MTPRRAADMQLLVSVVHEEEVAAAIAGGADIIDVKNPREGSLGANFPHVIRRVRELTPRDVPVSAAIGDAPNLPGMVALAAAGAATCGVQYVKVGLLGPREPRDALLLLTEVCRAAREQDPTVRIMATAYADAHRIGSFPPLDLPMVAAEAGADGCMLDTASKSGATLLSELGAAELETFVDRCRGNGLICALAGSLREQDVPRIHELAPDIIGVRTAACRGDRLTGRVDRDAVRSLKHLIAACGSLPSGPSRAARPDIPAVPR
ncbi:MAG: (5-formylfuran-3-yl)methyl phosphate synthase [Thermoleophilia bacterium]